MKKEIAVLWTEIRISKINQEDYICLTDIAKYKTNRPEQIIQNWFKK